MNTPARSSDSAMATPGRYLTFSLGRESYGLPVRDVREIIRLCPITPAPRMPPHVRGVINLRGSVIAVIDLRAKFELAPVDYGDRACIIVVQVLNPAGMGTRVGALVDTVEEVIQLTAEMIEPAPYFGGEPDMQFIQGVATVQGTVRTLLDIGQVFLEEGTITLPSAVESEEARISQ